MKNRFSRVLALGLLFCASLPSGAQPNIMLPEPAQMPPWKLSESSADALALIGAFYNKMSRAESYRGRLFIDVTSVKDGKVTSKKEFEMQSAWINDGKREGAMSKSVYNSTYTITEDGVTTTEKISDVQNGTKSYRFNETKNIWSERDQKINEKALLLRMTRSSWVYALAMLGAGSEFRSEHKTVDGKDLLVVTNSPIATGPSREYVFDANNGDLQSWTQVAGETTIKYRWLQNEFDVPLNASIFNWKTPEGATQVAPEAIDTRMQF